MLKSDVTVYTILLLLEVCNHFHMKAGQNCPKYVYCILEIEILRVLGIRIYENVVIVITLYIHITFLRFGQITQC